MVTIRVTRSNGTTIYEVLDGNELLRERNPNVNLPRRVIIEYDTLTSFLDTWGAEELRTEVAGLLGILDLPYRIVNVEGRELFRKE
ncbi:hypothetical protein [Alicyclobacillus acidiphilus]|uniref:hypothetical protein n=1 Tax=Alicyclobacillus acidiphilus TaxID=182455 RepID=UPI000829C7C0|nr:hypothetical protein [Alicyclobacillus acidiphilus]